MIVSTFLAIRFYKKAANVENAIMTDLIFTSLDFQMFFNDRENIVTSIAYDCEVNEDNYNKPLKRNILWTGSTYHYTKLVSADNGENFTLTDSTRKASPYTYVVHFNRSFSRGEHIKFKLETCVSDHDLTMTPIFFTLGKLSNP